LKESAEPSPKGSVKHERVLPLSGAFNFRDLGGYATVDGRVTRWRRLFRSDALHAITPEDLKVLNSLGVATVIDLRSRGEIEYTGRGLLGSSLVNLIEVHTCNDSFLGRAPSPPAFDAPLDEVYWHYLTSDSEKFVRALRELGRLENYPVVVSCFFGKDRTGVLAALVLECVGVGRELVIEDYALSATRMGCITQRLSEDPIYAETLERTPQSKLSAYPDTMRTFLERLETNFGGARTWALRSGISSEELDQLCLALLE
jgi:protein-tyrosine phosphatase